MPTPTRAAPSPPAAKSEVPSLTEEKPAGAGEAPSVITPSVEITYPPDGEPFLDVDLYLLRGGNTYFPIPGTDICIDGERLRTKQLFIVTQIVTDYSHPRCRIKEMGEDADDEICPPEADTEVIVFKGYPFVPVTYSQKVCLEYDYSRCRTKVREDAEDEVCPEYYEDQGTWVEGTDFQYPCKEWKARLYRHPLQYTIRFMVETVKGEAEAHEQELHRETRSIPPCQ